MKKYLLFLPILFLLNSFVTAQKKSSIENKKVQSLQIVVDSTVKASPGNVIPIGVKVFLVKGEPLNSEGFLLGNITWNNFVVTVVGGSFNKGGVTVGPDPRSFKDYKVVITVTDKFDDTKVAQTSISVDFNKNYKLDLSGKDGVTGDAGQQGKIGSPGTDSQAGDGPNGGNGGDGKNGKDGGDGINGPKITAWMVLVDDDALKSKMLRVKVKNENTGEEFYYLMYAEKNILSIVANGGNGGNGGDGGDGGEGGQGGKGSYAIPQNPGTENGRGGNGGNAGNGGNGGSGGKGGNGGTIVLNVDPSAAAYASNIRFLSTYGKAGFAGKLGKQGNIGKAGQGGLGAGVQGIYASDGIVGQNGVAGLDGIPAVIQNVKVDLPW